MPAVQPGYLSLYVARVSRHSRPLVEGDVIRQFDGTYHYIQYVNSSGAYAVPLAAVNREVKGHTIAFAMGGKTISANSGVEVVHPLTMGGNSPEYARYVKMASRSTKGLTVGTFTDESKLGGAALGEFDSTPAPDLDLQGTGMESGEGEGTPDTESSTARSQSKPERDKARLKRERAEYIMAKKAKKVAKSAAHKAKVANRKPVAPKTVRKCACGCGTETTGRFAPGHDARLHGWVKKLADGRIQRNGKDAKSGEAVVPASVLNKLGLVATKAGFKATTPHWYEQE